MLSLNDGKELYEIPVADGLENTDQLDAADFNQDGLLDVVSYNATTGDFWVSLNRGTHFEHQVWGNFLSTATWTNFTVGDFDGDSRPDILGAAGDNWWLASNNEGFRFLNHHWGTFPDFNWSDVIDGNFNGDQYQDIVAREPGGNTWWMWEGTASGFKAARFFGHWKMRDAWMDVGAGDFNGDQIDDVIGRSEDGRLWVGSTTPQGFHTWAWTTGWVNQAEWQDVQVVDINNDGLADQVGRSASGVWAYALNQGQTFQNHLLDRVAAGTSMLFTQDFRKPEPVGLVESFGFEKPIDVSVSLNPENRIVVTSSAPIDLLGINLQSPSGRLVPGDNPSPFTLFVVNRPTEVLLGAIGVSNSFLLEGSLTLDVGWTPGAEDGDLVVQFGATDQRVGVVLASVPASLNSSENEQTLTSDLNQSFYTQMADL